MQHMIKTDPIHLYRWILRECSYLPDPKARVYMKNYANSRFRKYVPRRSPTQRQTPPLKNLEIPTTEQQVKLLHKGRKLHSLLSRANQGYLSPLSNVLRQTYGRTGRRRRELMTELSQNPPRTGELDSSPTNQQQPPHQPSNSITPALSNPLIKSLIKSQSLHQEYLPDLSTKLKPSPKLPEKTIWNKPPSKTRIDKVTRKWYDKTMRQLYPPLPEIEYQEIHDLALGIKPWPAFKPRRLFPLNPTTTHNADLAKILVHGADKPKPRRSCKTERPHEITPRLMRRLLARVVLVHTPLLVTQQPINPNEHIAGLNDLSEVDVAIQIAVTSRPGNNSTSESQRDRSSTRNMQVSDDIATESPSAPSPSPTDTTVKYSRSWQSSSSDQTQYHYHWEQGRKPQYHVKIPTKEQAKMLFG